MNNTPQYTNLEDYSTQLRETIKKFFIVFRTSKPPRQMGSFEITIKSIYQNINDLKEIQKMREDMKKLPRLDIKAQKDNKHAEKAAEQIRQIKDELNQSYERLKEDFYKQMDLAGRQSMDVIQRIKDVEDKRRFNDARRNLLIMVDEAKYDKTRIPFDKTEEIVQLEQEKLKREHQEKEEQIDGNTKFNLQNTEELKNAMSVLRRMLETAPTNAISKEVRQEVAQIKKVLPSRTIAIAKENIERLRHSSHLVVDLYQINKIISATHGVGVRDRKLQKINNKLENLQIILEQAIREEREKEMNIQMESDIVQRRVDFATDAVKTYSDILNESATNLPEEYTDMKKRLQDISTLYQMTESKELTDEGMSR